MINYGFLVLENGKITEFDCKKNGNYFDHYDFAKQFLKTHKNYKTDYKLFLQEQSILSRLLNKKDVANEVDFLLQYLGFVRISNYYNNYQFSLTYYTQSDEFNNSPIGQARLNMLNNYRAKNYVDECLGEVPNSIIKLQHDGKIIETLNANNTISTEN